MAKDSWKALNRSINEIRQSVKDGHMSKAEAMKSIATLSFAAYRAKLEKRDDEIQVEKERLAKLEGMIDNEISEISESERELSQS